MHYQIALSSLLVVAVAANDSNINLPPYGRSSSLQRSTSAAKKSTATRSVSTKPTPSANAYNAYNAYVSDDSLPILQPEKKSSSTRARITQTSSLNGYQSDAPNSTPTPTPIPKVSIDNLPLAVTTTSLGAYVTESSSTNSKAGIVSGQVSSQVFSLPMLGIMSVANLFLLLKKSRECLPILQTCKKRTSITECFFYDTICYFLF